MKKMYIYTKYGEEFAAARGLEPRTAGTIARFGYEPLEPGSVAVHGFVEPVCVSSIPCCGCPKAEECTLKRVNIKED
jgi:hypothetical protein